MNKTIQEIVIKPNIAQKKKPLVSQPCQQCESPIGVLSGSMDAICKNCGYKDPCCE